VQRTWDMGANIQHPTCNMQAICCIDQHGAWGITQEVLIKYVQFYTKYCRISLDSRSKFTALQSCSCV